jgi:hypothetical protein
MAARSAEQAGFEKKGVRSNPILLTLPNEFHLSLSLFPQGGKGEGDRVSSTRPRIKITVG